MIAQLELEVAQLIERAQQAQVRETPATLDLPAELTRREKRVAALQQARQVIQERAREMAAAQQPQYEAKVAARKQQRDAWKKPHGKDPTPPDPTPDPKAQFNFTDPKSRIMKAGSGQHFEQACNAQAAVDEAMLIVGQPSQRRAQQQAGVGGDGRGHQPGGGAGSHSGLGRQRILQCSGGARRGTKARWHEHWQESVCGGGETFPS